MNPIDSQQEKIQMLREAYLDPKRSDVEREVILDMITDEKLKIMRKEAKADSRRRMVKHRLAWTLLNGLEVQDGGHIHQSSQWRLV